MLTIEDYSEIYLDKSWDWLNDPEIKKLTNTPDFTKEGQKLWFEGIFKNETYKVWGVRFDETPIGVFGIKNIDYQSSTGEYFGYIGEKKYWGKGLGKEILSKIVDKAKFDIKLETLYLKVLIENEVAINLYKKFNFIEKNNDGNEIIMFKSLK